MSFTEPIPLELIVYDTTARGLWCRSPYYNHPRGCPNFPKCIQKRPDFKSIEKEYNWFAVMEMFDLKHHAEEMKRKHPHWSERQCKNPLYWQGSVRKRLRDKAIAVKGDIILDIPEACGINVFETMAQIGIILERKPDLVRKVMLVGVKK